MNVNFFYKGTESGLIDEQRFDKLIEIILEKENFRKEKINIIFTSDKTLRKINKDFLGRDYLTDVITFGNAFKKTISGELYISIDRIKENCIKYSEGIFDRELKRIIIHGMLHLIGYNDESAQEKEIMKEKEDSYLNL